MSILSRVFAIIALTVVSVALIIFTRPDTQAKLQPLPPPRVVTDTVRLMDIQPLTVITGKLQPARKSQLRFEVSGQVTGRFVEPGQKVVANELLLEIDAGDYQDSVAEAEALLNQERKAIDRDRRLLDLVIKERQLLERDLARLQSLDERSLVSKAKYDEATQKLLRQRAEEARLRHSVATAQARLKGRSATLNRSQRNLKRANLVAPFAATVSVVNIEIGDYVSPGMVVMELVQLDEMDLYLEVPSTVITALHLGQMVNITIEEKKLTGKIIALAAEPDPNTNTYAIRIRLPGNGLVAGQLARAELPGEFLAQVPVVPVTAVLQEDGESYVFSVENNLVMKTPIRPVKRYRDLQVIDGLTPGIRIVVTDVDTLADRQKVSVK